MDPRHADRPMTLQRFLRECNTPARLLGPERARSDDLSLARYVAFHRDHGLVALFVVADPDGSAAEWRAIRLGSRGEMQPTGDEWPWVAREVLGAKLK